MKNQQSNEARAISQVSRRSLYLQVKAESEDESMPISEREQSMKKKRETVQH